MAFIPSASTVTLTAKLTPYGRQQLLVNSDSIVTQFSLGDSDANYRATNELQLGDVPSSAGSLVNNNSIANSVTNNVRIRSNILVNNLGETTKPIESNSTQVNAVEKSLPVQTITEADLRVIEINRTENLTDSLTNLFSSFGLPITEDSQSLFVDFSDANGGYNNTALRLLNQDKILVVSIDTSDYGEMIDGRVVNINVTTTANTYSMYTSYQKSLTPNAVQDTKTSEISPKAAAIGNNVAFLFSDVIQRPNNNLLRSWSTGFNTLKPFSVNKKELFNLVANPSNGLVVDTAVGVAYLDMGIIIITYPDIVNSYISGDSISITFGSVVTEVSQDITCIVNRGEFISSNNLTYNTGDLIRVSELGLHDSNGNLLAIAKTNKHILIGSNQFLAFGVKISV